MKDMDFPFGRSVWTNLKFKGQSIVSLSHGSVAGALLRLTSRDLHFEVSCGGSIVQCSEKELVHAAGTQVYYSPSGQFDKGNASLAQVLNCRKDTASSSSGFVYTLMIRASEESETHHVIEGVPSSHFKCNLLSLS